ncbi:MAG: substrate-binding domain-containing protein [Rhodospirillaceae bacterium]|jgi:molybdate transport system substrate-binding protein|nr:substrate-binding domain-containing protein [Rhodospirillaceae bacterium]
MASDEIKILSAGAPKSAVAACADAFSEKTGIPIWYEFATAPILKEIVGSGNCEADIVVAPVGASETFAAEDHVIADSGSVLGSVKAAVTIKSGAIEPDLSSAETLKQALLGADSIVYNEASSGQYIHTMIEQMGITDAVTDKVTRTKTGSAVMEHLHASSLMNEIGFGQATEIQVQINKGLDVKLLGTLPKEVEKISTYQSALLVGSEGNQAAKDLLEFIASEEGQRICKTTGLI